MRLAGAGVPGLRFWNITVNALFYAGGIVLLYQFWRYIRYALALDDKRARLSSLILQAALISIVLIYCVLFSERSKSLAATQTELRTATQIQEAMLPNVFPPYPERGEFDLYASMDPAREVGGDFYDFFLVDDDHLCMVMADVSGKGVPAALFMMASKIILANNAKMGKSPALRRADGTSEELLKTVRRAVDGFVQGAEQFDDLTMLCLEYKGSKQR